jgi:hypothetical protein
LVAAGDLVGQPFQGWDALAAHTQGRCSFLAPTLGFVGKPLWGLDAATRRHPKYFRRYETTVE